MPSVGWLSVPGVQLAVVVLELFIGTSLIFGIAKPFTWLAALGMFTVFAFISGYLGFIGQATCGCFGTVEASPWAAFVVDIVAVGLLLIARPRWQSAEVRPWFLGSVKLLGDRDRGPACSR